MGPGDGLNKQAFQPCEVWLEFADGDYLFRLGLKQLAELQEKCNASIGVIYMRLELGEYKAEDLFETIRLGLIGGNSGWVNETEIRVPDMKARRLIENYCEGKPLEYLWNLARSVMRSCVHGYESKDPRPPKPMAATMESEPTGSTSPRPTQMEPASTE